MVRKVRQPGSGLEGGAEDISREQCYHYSETNASDIWQGRFSISIDNMCGQIAGLVFGLCGRERYDEAAVGSYYREGERSYSGSGGAVFPSHESPSPPSSSSSP